MASGEFTMIVRGAGTAVWLYHSFRPRAPIVPVVVVVPDGIGGAAEHLGPLAPA